MRDRIHALFMSRQQTVYLFTLMLNCVIYGMLMPTFLMLDIGLGSRVYSIQLIVSCLIGLVSAYIASDVNKKRWVFCHFKAIDISKTLFFTVVELSFFLAYMIGKYDPTVDWEGVCRLFFVHDLLLRIVRFITEMIIPSIGDVFEQSLYKNQIDYQNHSNAERLMSNVGAVIGALSALAVGDFFKEHVWLIFFVTVFDWIGLWGRWQFYYNKQNFAIIVRNFAHESNEWRRTHSGKQK